MMSDKTKNYTQLLFLGYPSLPHNKRYHDRCRIPLWHYRCIRYSWADTWSLEIYL